MTSTQQARQSSSYRLGVDVGGTFTDLVLLDQATGRVATAKVLSTSEDQAIGVARGIERICSDNSVDPEQITDLLHGTTVATNAVLTRSGARVGLVTSRGYRQVLHVARSAVPGGIGGWIVWQKRDPIAPLEWTVEIPERIDNHGAVIEPIDRAEVRRQLLRLKSEGIEALTVSLLHSYANPAHEIVVRDIAGEVMPAIPVSLSSEVIPEMQEYERAETTVVNSYVRPVVARYVANLKKHLDRSIGKAQLAILRSDGGLSSAQAAVLSPVNLLMSGPAGGVAGAVWMARRAGLKDVITCDMGGTSTDVALIRDGVAQSRRETHVGDISVRASSIDVRTVGAGGGSIAYVPELTGALRVGPQSAGSTPGPAAYGRGGTEPTVTDAHVVLGHLPAEVRLGGQLVLDRESARAAVGKVAAALGMSVEKAAQGIVDIANEHMHGALRLVSVEQGYDPSGSALVAFGGAGPLHANALGRLIGAWPVVIPPGPGVLCAYGDATTRLRDETSQTYVRSLEDANIDELRDRLAALAKQASERLVLGGVQRAEIEVNYQLDLRYRGQGTQLTVEIAPVELALEEVTRRFDQLHAQLFTFSLAQPHEIVNLRAIVQGAAPAAEVPQLPSDGADAGAAVVGTSEVFSEGRWVPARIYDRSKLRAGNRIDGPAVVVEMDATTLVLAEHSATVHPSGCLFIVPSSTAANCTAGER